MIPFMTLYINPYKKVLPKNSHKGNNMIPFMTFYIKPYKKVLPKIVIKEYLMIENIIPFMSFYKKPIKRFSKRVIKEIIMGDREQYFLYDVVKK